MPSPWDSWGGREDDAGGYLPLEFPPSPAKRAEVQVSDLQPCDSEV